MRPATIDDAALVEVLRQRRAEARHKLRLIKAQRRRMRPATAYALFGVAILGAALLLRGVL